MPLSKQSAFVQTAGFPLPEKALPSTGTATLAVLFVDYRDAVAGHSTHEEADPALRIMEEYLEASSYQQLDIDFRPLHRWLRASHDHAHYGALSALDLRGEDDTPVGADIVAEAVALADDEVDFTGVDVVMVVGPSSHLGGGAGGDLSSVSTDEGPHGQRLLVNNFAEYPRGGVGNWGRTALHEFLHLLGLPDLYPYDASRAGESLAASGENRVLIAFGALGLRAYVPVEDDQAIPQFVLASEMLAWSRWQLGWLDAEQTRCATEDEATVTLSPVADPGSATAMAAVPLSETEILVVESRRSIGYDSDMTLMAESDWRGVGYVPGPALLAEGVLVYTVDAAVESGSLPVRLAYDSDNAYIGSYPLLSDSPVLGVGQSVTVRGYTITVVSDDGATHTVTIAKADDA